MNKYLMLLAFAGLHEEVDYSEKLKFSDDEEDHTSAEKKNKWLVSAIRGPKTARYDS